MKKLYRSRRDKMVTGLCGGLAEYLNVDATLLRIVVVIVAIFSTGVPIILIYIVACLVIPKEPGTEPPYTGGMYGGAPPSGGSYSQHSYNQTHNPNHGPFSHNGGHGYSPNRPTAYSNPPQPPAAPPRDDLDEMMKDIEKKALRREVEELKAKLAKYENNKGEN